MLLSSDRTLTEGSANLSRFSLLSSLGKTAALSGLTDAALPPRLAGILAACHVALLPLPSDEVLQGLLKSVALHLSQQLSPHIFVVHFSLSEASGKQELSSERRSIAVFDEHLWQQRASPGFGSFSLLSASGDLTDFNSD